MKLVRLLLTTATAATAFACSPRHGIVATFTGFRNDTVVVRSQPLSHYGTAAAENPGIRMDTLLLDAEGRLQADPAVEEPTLFMLLPLQFTEEGMTLPGGSFSFVLDRWERIGLNAASETGRLRIEIVSGSETNRDLAEYANLWNPAGAAMGTLQTELMRRAQQGLDPGDSLRQAYRSCMEQALEINRRYIATHPDRPAAAFVLAGSGASVAGRYLDSLTDGVRNSVFKPMLDRIEQGLEAERMRKEAFERVKPGAKAPDFTLRNTEGAQSASRRCAGGTSFSTSGAVGAAGASRDSPNSRPATSATRGVSKWSVSPATTRTTSGVRQLPRTGFHGSTSSTRAEQPPKRMSHCATASGPFPRRSSWTPKGASPKSSSANVRDSPKRWTGC